MTAGVCLNDDIIGDALQKLRGAVTIVYPMGLPPYDPIRLEFEGQEDLSGTQVSGRVDRCGLGHYCYCIGLIGCARGEQCSVVVGWEATAAWEETEGLRW